MLLCAYSRDQYFYWLDDGVGNSLDLAKETGLVLFVHKDPLLDTGQVPEGVEASNGLVDKR